MVFHHVKLKPPFILVGEISWKKSHGKMSSSSVKNLWTIPSGSTKKSQVKKGLLCQLFGGTAKPVSSKAETKGPRADIHGFQREDPGKTIIGDVMGISSENHLYMYVYIYIYDYLLLLFTILHIYIYIMYKGDFLGNIVYKK